MVQSQVYLGSHSVNSLQFWSRLVQRMCKSPVSIHSILPPSLPPAYHEACESLWKNAEWRLEPQCGHRWAMGCLVCLVFKFLSSDCRIYASLSVTQTWCPGCAFTSQRFSVLSAGVQSSATRYRLSLERLREPLWTAVLIFKATALEPQGSL